MIWILILIVILTVILSILLSKYSFQMSYTIPNQQTQQLDPFDVYLIQQGDNIHEAVQDIINFKLEDVRRTKVEDLSNILSLFRGRTPYQQRESLIEFLRLMPEYKTSDPEKLYQRLSTLQAHLKTTGDVTDLLVWAMYKHQKFLESKENAT